MITLIGLSVLVSLDGFFSGLSFGLKQIRISLAKLILISCCPLVVVSAVMLSSAWITGAVTDEAANGLGFVLFFILAYLSLSDALKKKKNQNVSLFSLINDPASSDLDHDQNISAREALLLGLALSLDNAVLGFSFALDGAAVLPTALCFALVNLLLVKAGNACAAFPVLNRLKKGSEFLPSILFLILAFSRLL